MWPKGVADAKTQQRGARAQVGIGRHSLKLLIPAPRLAGQFPFGYTPCVVLFLVDSFSIPAGWHRRGVPVFRNRVIAVEEGVGFDEMSGYDGFMATG